jgi:photosystem II stability/assembly factor-like uncharacterized protein
LITVPAFCAWTQLAIPAGGETLRDLHFIDDLTGYVVGSNGIILKTTDGGSSWYDQSAGSSTLRSIHIAPPGPSYENLLTYTETDPLGNVTTNRYDTHINGDSITGQNTYLYYQYPADAGVAGLFNDALGYEHLFEFVVSPDERDNNYLCPWVVSNQTVSYDNLTSGYSFCVFELNSGKLRTEIYNNNTTDVDFSNMQATWINTTIYGRAEVIPGGNATITLYSDAARTVLISGGGFTNPLQVTASNLSYRYLYALNADVRDPWEQSLIVQNIDIQKDTGYIGRDNGSVLRTTSGGAGFPTGWNPDPTGSSDDLRGIYFTDPSTGWAVSDQGRIYQTLDGGGSWSLRYSNSEPNFDAIDCIDGTTRCWAVDKDGGWVVATNNGVNWSKIADVNSGIRGIFFLDALTGWTVGKDGDIFKSTDGGTNWTPQNSGSSRDFRDVHFIDANNGWAVAGNGTIVYTDNGGTSWGPQVSPTSEDLRAISISASGVGYIVGNNGVFLKTTDGGGAIIPGPQMFKKAFLPDGSPVIDGATLPQGTMVNFLIYINNTGAAQNDVSVRDILDPTFFYQTTSIKVDNSQSSCATSPCSTAEEIAIFSAVNGTAALTDPGSLADVASFTNGDTIDTGNANIGNAQLDISGNAVWALLFTTQLQ